MHLKSEKYFLTSFSILVLMSGISNQIITELNLAGHIGLFWRNEYTDLH
jgi:hypothetical protein